MYSTGNYIQYPVINHNGTEYKKECIYVWVILAQHRKSTILQFGTTVYWHKSTILQFLKNWTREKKCMWMFITALFTIAKIWNQPTCLLIDEWIKMWHIYISISHIYTYININVYNAEKFIWVFHKMVQKIWMNFLANPIHTQNGILGHKKNEILPFETTWMYLESTIGEGSGTPLQSSCLENPMDGGAWWAAVHGVTKSQTQLSDFTFTLWRRKWQPTPVFLLGESQGRGSLVGCRLWGRTELYRTEAT